MTARRWFTLLALLAAAAPVAAQAKPKNALEERFKTSRLDPPTNSVTQKFSLLNKGNVNLSPPSDDDRAVLETTAKQTVYPLTHFELYSAVETATAELAPRPDEKTVGRLMTELRGQLVPVTPGDAGIPPTRVDFTREYGAAVVKAIDEVLAKPSLPVVVRGNAIRMLAVLAESGAPAAFERVVKLLEDKAPAVESLYYGLKAAENAIAMYDPLRSAANQNWVSKDRFFVLVKMVDDIAQKVPAVVIEKTYQPDAAPGAPAPDPKAALTPEQVATVQAFRLQAIRALSKVRTDTVTDLKGEKVCRPLYTLARVAVSDPTLSPPPNFKELAEAVIGLGAAVPGADVDGGVLGAVIARGVGEFVADKVADARVGGVDEKAPTTHWKMYGARMKVAYMGWEANLPKSKLPKADRDSLASLSQLSISGVFEPLSKTDDKGVAPGLKNSEVIDWYTKKVATLKADPPLFKDVPATSLPLKGAGGK